VLRSGQDRVGNKHPLPIDSLKGGRHEAELFHDERIAIDEDEIA
jgi:hypothetical protein